MLTVSQVSKSFAGRILFKDASLQVNRGDRIGLVGPNGAGKSTLFSLLLGDASPDEGRITARNLLSRPPHRKRSERGRASGSEGVWGERGVKRG